MRLYRRYERLTTCTRCGGEVTFQQNFCPKCGAPSPRAEQHASDTCHLEVVCEEIGPARLGQSILRSMVGASNLADWRFVGRATGSGLTSHADIYETTFQIDYGRVVEFATGINRTHAQDALRQMHRLIVKDGWKPAEPGQFWYSYRYTAPKSILKRLGG
jgi:hypothetical protein